MSYFTTPTGAEIYFEDVGRGLPLVFIHGWPLSGAMWEYQIVPLLSAGFRCITYDRRGFGRSSKTALPHDYDALTGDLAALLDHLDVSDATLIGFSMGGGEAVRYLANHNRQNRATRAMLIASVVPFMLKTSDNPEGVDASVFNEMKSGIREDRPAFLTDFNKTFFGAGLLSSPISDPMLAACCEIGMQASPVATLACASSFAETDFRADCRAVRVPVLVIHGDSDATVPIAASGARAAEMIPSAELKIYSGAPHGLFYTHRQDLNRDIAAFASGGRIALLDAA